MILEPKQEILNDLKNALDVGLPLYMTYAHKFGDCADKLSELLTKNGKIIWQVCPCITTKAVFPYVHSASVTKIGIIIILDPETVEGDDILDVEKFRKYTTHCIEHEAVHISQRDRMGHEIYENSNRISGFQKMKNYYLTCDDPHNMSEEEEFIGMRLYLADYLELMAHAKDLSSEILYADEPLVALRDPEGYIDYLPTWYKYRQVGFIRSDPVIKQLLKYTYNYVILALR